MANILIADDDKDIIRMLRFYLEKEGFQIYEAYDGNMAFMVLQNYGIDVALVDIITLAVKNRQCLWCSR